MRYRTIDVRLWGDVKFRSLSPLQPSGQALFLYLLVNPNTTSIPGIYRAGAAAMAEELGWAIEDFQKAFAEVLEQGLVKADLKARFIFIPNAIKYNKPQSPNVVKSWIAYWDELPECPLKEQAFQALKAFIESLGKAFVKAFNEAFSKPLAKTMPNQEQEQEQEQEINIPQACVDSNSPNPAINNNATAECQEKTTSQTDDIQKVFTHWQQVMRHPQAKLDKKRRSRIEQALKLYSIDQLIQAINGCACTPFNMGINDRRQKYDDIELILRDSSHIEQFMSTTGGVHSPVVSVGNDATFAGGI